MNGSHWTLGRSSNLRYLALIAVLLVGACSKKEENVESPAAANSSPVVAASPDSPTATAAAETASSDALAAELTQVVRKYAAEKQRAPKSFDELVAAGYLPSAPSAPGGKKFAIDKNLQVYLADQ
jgi:hypothetical protein